MAEKTLPAAAEQVAGESPSDKALLDALQAARHSLDDAHLGARAIIALLEKIDLADVVAASNCHSNDYDLVFAVESLLANLRDSSDDAGNKIRNLLDRVPAVMEVSQ